MDNSLERGGSRACFGPDRRLTALQAALALLAGYAAWAAPNAQGRLLFALAAAILLAYTLCDLIFAPRLCVTTEGVEVNSPLARARLRWAEIDAIRADVRSRHGVRTSTLEIDAGNRLIVLGRRALGATPEAVAEAAREFDPRGWPTDA